MDLSARFSDAFSPNGNGHPHGERNGTLDAAHGPTAALVDPASTPSESSQEEKSKWHDARGRFVKGNPGGPGNPYNRQVAAAKREAADFMTPERMHEFCTILFERVRQGDMAAARILRDLAVPKGIDPDTVHLHEWKLLQEETKMIGPPGTPWGEMRQLRQTPDPEVMLGLVRQARAGQTEAFARYLKGRDVMGPENMKDVRAMEPTEGLSIMNEVGGNSKKGHQWLKQQERRAKRRKR